MNERIAELRAQAARGGWASNRSVLEIFDALDAAEARVKALEEALIWARGHMLNAKIDLETRSRKQTAIDTLTGGLRMLDAALASKEECGG